MPRKVRTISEYQHVIVRGNGKQILFEDDGDRLYYLSLIQRYKEEVGIKILAYCLMENHVHLLLFNSSGQIPNYMKKVGVSYAGYYNRKYKRSGHLFQDRYKSESITDDAHLLTAYRYILKNPEKAGIMRADKYQWSSYNEYKTSSGITDAYMLRKMIGNKNSFDKFMKMEDFTECMEAYNRKNDDEWALSIIKSTLKVLSGTELQKFKREDRDAAIMILKTKGLTIRQIERLTGINRGVIQKAKFQNDGSFSAMP